MVDGVPRATGATDEMVVSQYNMVLQHRTGRAHSNTVQNASLGGTMRRVTCWGSTSAVAL